MRIIIPSQMAWTNVTEYFFIYFASLLQAPRFTYLHNASIKIKDKQICQIVQHDYSKTVAIWTRGLYTDIGDKHVPPPVHLQRTGLGACAHRFVAYQCIMHHA